MTIGKKLQLLRKARGLSQENLAEQLGVSRQAVSKWELDAALPDTANVVTLSRIFGVTTDYLLIEENVPNAAAPAHGASARDGKRIAGFCCAGFGGLGLFVLFVISRFVEVMIPRVEYINGTEMTTWDSSVTGIDLRLFLEEYKLNGLVAFFFICIVVGAALICWDRWLAPLIKKHSRSLM